MVTAGHPGHTNAVDHSAAVFGHPAQETAADVVCWTRTGALSVVPRDHTAACEKSKLRAHDQSPLIGHEGDALDHAETGGWSLSISCRATCTHRGEDGALR